MKSRAKIQEFTTFDRKWRTIATVDSEVNARYIKNELMLDPLPGYKYRVKNLDGNVL